jgi:hypothetical protein
VFKLIIRHGPRAVPIWMGPLEDPLPPGIRGPNQRALARALDYALAAVDPRKPHDVELWNVQECRRSSMWRLQLDRRKLALHVARNHREAADLVAMGNELRALHAVDPLGVVDVLDIAPDVLACTWIDGRELQVVDRGDGRGLFIAAEESVPASAGRQPMLTGRAGVPASDAIWASWLEALVRQTTVRANGLLSRPHVEACEGDLVLLNEQPVLVSLRPGPIVRDRESWERDLLDLRSGERSRAFRWGDRASARSALRRALTAHGDPARAPLAR